MKKEPKCTHCGGAHYKISCFSAPRAPIKQKTFIISSKPKKPLRTARISSQGTSERSKLTREADRVFSLYIRQRYAKKGMARCVTCGIIDNYKSMDCGHYISRKFMSTRYDERNCHVQCRVCNRDMKGNLQRYKTYLTLKYGMDIIDELKLQANRGSKVTSVDLKDIILRYK